MLPDYLRLWNVWGTMEMLLSETGHEGSYNMSGSPASGDDYDFGTLCPSLLPPFSRKF